MCRDDLYNDAVRVISETDGASPIKRLQDHLGIDCARATVLINILYQEGKIGPYAEGISDRAIGEVIHYSTNSNICSIKITEGYIKNGNWLMFEGEKRNYFKEIEVDSIRIGGQVVTVVKAGQSFEFLFPVQAKSFLNFLKSQAHPEAGDVVKLTCRARPMTLPSAKEW